MSVSTECATALLSVRYPSYIGVHIKQVSIEQGLTLIFD